MLIEVPPLPRRGRPYVPKRKRRPAPAPPAPLTLVSASYDADNLWLFLTFDRAIAVDGMLNGDAIRVDDGVTSHDWYNGDGSPEFPDPAMIKINLSGGKASEATQVLLNASDATQIVAVDNGGIWEGCTNLVVPFP